MYMIVNSDTQLIEQAKVDSQRLINLESAIRFTLYEIKPEYRWGTVHVWLSFNFIKRPSCRITPEITIHTDTWFDNPIDPETVELDLPDCLRQVNDRFNREHVTWGELKLDIRKQRVNNHYNWTLKLGQFKRKAKV